MDNHHTADQRAAGRPAFDSDGYTTDPAHWNDDATRQTADQDGFPELGSAQWDIIHTIHSLYDRNGASPSVHQLCHHLHTETRHVEALFGSPQEAYRLAGVPNPGEEAKSYL